MSSAYMDIEDFMEVLDQSTTGNMANESRPNYDMLLQSLASLGKMIDKGENQGNLNKMDSSNQDLTADLFSTMSDSEMLNHFIPMKGIDYDQYSYDGDMLKKANEKNEPIQHMPSADEFMPYKMMPQLNPVYKLTSAFKPVAQRSVQEKKEEICKDEEIDDEDDYSDEEENVCVDDSLLPNKSTSKSPINQALKKENGEPRQIKKRKPRTYKYNPKPLQHKICRAFVPDDLKDREYWERRKRNNEAAKKSREERRKKELEIMNSYEMMKQEYSQIKIENIRLKARNSVLENQVTELKEKMKK